jgi:four helix bundle protein
MAGHRDLRGWQDAMELAEAVYTLTRAFPRDEIYGLTSQMNRASVSVPSNIAEGYGRGGKDYERFVGLAYGSLLEIETQIELAHRVGLVAKERADGLLGLCGRVGRQLNALRNGLRRSRSSSEP